MQKKKVFMFTTFLTAIVAIIVVATLIIFNTSFRDKEVMRINNVIIRESEFKFYCSLTLTDNDFVYNNMYNADYQGKIKEKATTYAQDYVCRLDEAKKGGYSLTTEEKQEVEKSIADQIKASNKSEKDYFNYFFGITKEQYTNYCHNLALISKVQKGESEKVIVTEELQKIAFEKYKKSIESADVSYLAFTIKSESGEVLTDSEIASRQTIAEEIKVKLEKGENINDLAKQYKAGNIPIDLNGTLTILSTDTYAKKIIDWALGSKVGQVGIVTTKDELVILKCDKLNSLNELMNSEQLKQAARYYEFEKRIEDILKTDAFSVKKKGNEYKNIDLKNIIEGIS